MASTPKKAVSVIQAAAQAPLRRWRALEDAVQANRAGQYLTGFDVNGEPTYSGAQYSGGAGENGLAWGLDAPSEHISAGARENFDLGDEQRAGAAALKLLRAWAQRSAERARAQAEEEIEIKAAHERVRAAKEFDLLPWYLKALVAANDSARIFANQVTFDQADRLSAWLNGTSLDAERGATNRAIGRAGNAVPALGLIAAFAQPTMAAPKLLKALRGMTGLLGRSAFTGTQVAAYSGLGAGLKGQPIMPSAFEGFALGTAGNALGEKIGGLLGRAASARNMRARMAPLTQADLEAFRDQLADSTVDIAAYAPTFLRWVRDEDRMERMARRPLSTAKEPRLRQTRAGAQSTSADKQPRLRPGRPDALPVLAPKGPRLGTGQRRTSIDILDPHPIYNWPDVIQAVKDPRLGPTLRTQLLKQLLHSPAANSGR